MAIEYATRAGRIPEGLRQWIKDGRPRGAHYRSNPDGSVTREWTISEMRERLDARRDRIQPASRRLTLSEMQARHRQIAAKYGLPL